ncbi:cell division protein FtsL [Bacillus sp. HMF5848]|uniref:cell division protein FtsL n=1 Tax=Bacillus sp. HMF5848 TaxID=2495421 RepID=UPI000F76C9C9|nr:cell division protein FtsL [Bacillus sp. HMF5848]RSK26934.1 cell division protein FtsL [Bacillus sp. HMF5848]
MSNLARRYYQEQQPKQPTITPQPKKKRVRVKKIKYSAAEKLMCFVLISFVFLFSVKIVSNWAYIYNVNTEIHNLQQSIHNKQKYNDDLSVQVSELSTYERIWTIAAEMGLSLNENNVKVVEN